jgi:hypothetical protein
MSKIEFRIVVVEDGEEVLSERLSYDILTTIASYYPDLVKSQQFFKFASKHPSADVRLQVAGKSKINEESCRNLIDDDSVAVLKNLVTNTAFKEIATLDVLKKYLELDKDLAETIAYDVESFKSVDILNLAEIVAANKDPSVVAALAGNKRAPKKVLRDLLDHEDPLVSERASESLR